MSTAAAATTTAGANPPRAAPQPSLPTPAHAERGRGGEGERGRGGEGERGRRGGSVLLDLYVSTLSAGVGFLVQKAQQTGEDSKTKLINLGVLKVSL